MLFPDNHPVFAMENNLGDRFGKRSSLSAEIPQENSLANADVTNSLDAWLAKNDIPQRLVSLNDFQGTLSTDYFNSKQKRFRPVRRPNFINWAFKPNFPLYPKRFGSSRLALGKLGFKKSNFPPYTNEKRLIPSENRNTDENKEDSQESMGTALESKTLNKIETRGTRFRMPPRSFLREIMERFRVLSKSRATRRVDSAQTIPKNMSNFLELIERMKKSSNPFGRILLASFNDKLRNYLANNIRVVRLKKSLPYYLLH